MTPRKPKPAEAKKPFAASGKITKPKATAQSAQLPTVHGKGVREYRNGTLNLEKTPEHLVAAAKFNANQPLLHLPAIAAPSSRAQKPNLGPNKQKGGAAEVTEDTHLNLTHQNLFYVNALQSVTRVPLAFRLPEVCRQIYSETALTAYRENTFVYGELHWMYRSAKLQLSAAQRRAMTSIELERVTFSAMSILNPYPESIRWNGLPNVQTVFVTSRAMRCMELDLTRSTFDVEKTFWGKEQWRKFVTDTMQSREGSDLQVVFR